VRCRPDARAGRAATGEDVQAVEEVGAEAALGHFGRQVAVGRGDDAHVDLDRLGRTDGDDLAFLKRAQQLGLQRQRHLGDLVEQQRAAVGSAEEALAGLGGAGEGALGVAEQQGLKHGFGHGRAVDGDEGTLGAGLRSWMKRLSTSLPVPVGPPISTGMSLAARRSARARIEMLSGSAAMGAPGRVAQAIRAARLESLTGSV
jgi:hypothetical protein